MRVGEACCRRVVIVKGEESVLEAARLMREQHVGSVVVVREEDRGRIPVGILTDRDIVVSLVAQELSDLKGWVVGDVVTCDLLTAGENECVSDVLRRMREHGVRRAPVVGPEGTLVGILAVDDVLDLLAEQLGDVAALIAREQREEQAHRP